MVSVIGMDDVLIAEQISQVVVLVDVVYLITLYVLQGKAKEEVGEEPIDE